MDVYQTQLRTLGKLIDNLIPIETQLEQKLTACEYNGNYQVSTAATRVYPRARTVFCSRLVRTARRPTAHGQVRAVNRSPGAHGQPAGDEFAFENPQSLRM